MFNIKRILTLTLPILALALCTPVSVSAVQEYNPWNQTTHSKTDSCSVCGGDDKISVSCPKTVRSVCNPYQICAGCWNSGTDCSRCGGDGEENCGRCGGTGTYVRKCSVCKGEGTKLVECTASNCTKGAVIVYDITVPTLSLSKSLDATGSGYQGEGVDVSALARDNLSGAHSYEFSYEVVQ